MEPRRSDTDLATELRALRPTPRPGFTAELDARAAAGFPFEREAGESAFGRATAWLQPAGRRLPALAGAVGTIAIAVATAAIALSEQTTVGPPEADRLSASPHRLERAAKRPPVQFSARPPMAKAPGGGAGLQGGRAAAAEGLAPAGPLLTPASGRDVERSASIVLAAEDSQIRTIATRVFETVRSYDGIVLRSSISAGEGATNGGAVFDLLIPGGKLGGAMAAFSEIADVRSRRDATSDVTRVTTGLEERLRDSRARIESLLAELADAPDEAQREALERELRWERRQAAGLRSSLRTMQRRVSLSRVSLRIVGGAGASTDGHWGVADAFDDAGRILGIAAGVAVIGLAVLGPLALLLVLAWLATRRWAKRSREHALD
ncbi:MAG TPA: DUF4349 domain-containing protein [Solirubrobacterales bacterium]|nr:DUF4349 domain-containing protein [Solirubrobacterales bacterium]